MPVQPRGERSVNPYTSYNELPDLLDMLPENLNPFERKVVESYLERERLRKDPEYAAKALEAKRAINREKARRAYANIKKDPRRMRLRAAKKARVRALGRIALLEQATIDLERRPATELEINILKYKLEQLTKEIGDLLTKKTAVV